MKPYSSFPRALRIGPYLVSVNVKTLNTESEYNWGTFEDNKQLIEFDVEPPSAEFAVDTALHEIGHAIFKWGGLKVGDDEERVVSVFATWLTMIFRDNPDLLGWIRAQLASRNRAKSV